MFIDSNGNLYRGDMRPGDREATDAEIAAWESRRIVPQVVSRFQARAALHQAGHLAAVEALMADPETPALARLAWQDAQEFKRTSPTVIAMAGALGLNDAQIGDLFLAAATIQA